MRTTLAIDAGGTSSRAALIDATGRCLATARAAGGNPTSSGIAAAAAQIADAAAHTIAAARAQHPGIEILPGSVVAITQAGQVTEAYRAALLAHLTPYGFTRILIESDLLGMFGSGSASPEGIVLIAGTGSVAGRVSGGSIVQEVGGAGWLLGDGGSGFWIGRRVLRAVTADLDGLGRSTALTGLVIRALGLPPELDPVGRSPRRRSSTLDALIGEVNAGPPVTSSRLAPLAFAALGDEVAAEIREGAVDRLVALVRAVAHQSSGRDSTLVVGGSVLVDGILPGVPSATERLSAAAGGAALVPVADGLIGAASFGIRSLGTAVDEELHHRLTVSLAHTRPGAHA